LLLFYNRKEKTTLKMHTGFVGLGIMGQGMAARLLSEGKAGTTDDTALVVWNRTKSKCQELAEKFPDKKVIIKDTAKEVVEACKITYSMLSTPEVSKAVFEAPDGVLAGVSDGKCIVDCATLAEVNTFCICFFVCIDTKSQNYFNYFLCTNLSLLKPLIFFSIAGRHGSYEQSSHREGRVSAVVEIAN
jgi:hypothetical protein